MNENNAARLLLIGGDEALAAALAVHCAGSDLARRADAVAALEYLARNAAAPPRLIAVDAGGADAVAVTAAIKGDPRFRVLPVLVLAAQAGQRDACYAAGANACVLRPPEPAALQATVAALAGFWLDANEIPPGAL